MSHIQTISSRLSLRAPQKESLEILGKIASVHLELEGVSGTLAGSGVSMSDVFTLMVTEQGWTIVQKAFHWHM